MKIHKLKMTAFGPFATTESIDLDEVNRAGTFLLTGPTGSGKTTVLDAICFALYGEIPRSGKSPDVASHYRDPSTSPEVELDATIGDSRLRITRSPKFERPKLKGEGTTEVNPTAVVEEMSSGEWKLVSSGLTEANDEIKGRIGMDAGQFSQVVMLPQGSFATFLQAKVDERKALLAKLFPTQDLAYAEKWLHDRNKEAAAEQKGKIAKIKTRIDGGWGAVAGLAAEALASSDDDEQPALQGSLLPEELPDPADADEVTAWITEIRVVLERLLGEAGRSETATREEFRQAEVANQGAEKRAELIRARAGAEARMKELNRQDDEQRQLRAAVEIASRAAVVAPLAGSATGFKTQRDQATAAHAELVESLESREEIESTGTPELKDLRGRFESDLTIIAEFERDELASRRRLEKDLKKLKAEMERLAGTESGLGADLAAAQSKLDKSEAEASAAQADYIKIRHRRTEGMAAELAEDLEPGEPCTVCGSTEHPSPAKALEHAPTRVDEEQADERVAAARKNEQADRSGLANAKAKLTARESEIKTELANAEKIVAEIRSAEERLSGSDPSIEARRERLAELVRTIGQCVETGERAANASDSHESAERDALATAVEHGFADLEEAAAAVVEAEELKQMVSRSKKYDQDLATVTSRLSEEELAGVDPEEEIDLKPLASALATTRAALDKRMAWANTCRNWSKGFATQADPIPNLLDELEPLTESARRARELDDLTNGKNRQRMKLSIYVLAARLRQVIEAANTKLEPMSDGQYELIYSDGLASGGGASGLEIEVFDHHSSTSRATETLSGGESFYASLALALGLAEIVQNEAGARKLETLFIDEGFGTLDSDTLDKVMAQIDSLRENGRTVGLVSHVEELRSQVQAKIEIERAEIGSTISVAGL